MSVYDVGGWGFVGYHDILICTFPMDRRGLIRIRIRFQDQQGSRSDVLLCCHRAFVAHNISYYATLTETARMKPGMFSSKRSSHETEKVLFWIRMSFDY